MGWEVQEAAVLVQLIQVGRETWTKLEALEDNLAAQMMALED